MSQPVECSICAGKITLTDDVLQGELIECPECGSELEVTSIEPFQVQEAPQEEEDWGE